MEYVKFSKFIVSTQYGYTAEETSWIEGDAKYLRITDIVPYFVNKDQVPFCKIDDNKKKKYLINENDLLIARTGATTGYNLVVDDSYKNFVFASYLIRFNYNKNDLYPLYLKYVLKSQQWYGFVNNFISGSAQPGMNAKAFGKFQIPFFNYDSQKRISNILSTYDKLIDNNNKRIRLLEQMAENLYKEWFVRFRFPGYENTKFVDGIPSDWQILRMSDFCYVTDGTHDTPKPVNDDGVPLVTGKCIKNGFIDFNEPYNISYQDHESISKRSGLKTGDILFSNIGTVGTTCLVNYDREFSVKNVIILKPDNIKVSNYLYSWLNSDSIQAIFATQTNGASQQFVGLNFMRRFKILVPSENVLDFYSGRIKPIRSEIVKLHDINENLTKQRDMLLPRLMSGKLEV